MEIQMLNRTQTVLFSYLCVFLLIKIMHSVIFQEFTVDRDVF